MKDVKFLLAADPTGETARKYGVYIEEAGLARRGRFIINPDGVIVAEEVLNPPVGRNVNELLRQLDAWKYIHTTVSKHDENIKRTGTCSQFLSIMD